MANATNEKLVGTYIAMRDRVAEIAATAKKDKADVEVSMGKIEVEIKKRLLTSGTTSFKTNAGTAFTTKKDFVGVKDHTMFLRFIIGEVFNAGGFAEPEPSVMDDILSNGPWQFFNKSIVKDAVKTYMSENNGEVTPGAKYSTESVIQVRK